MKTPYEVAPTGIYFVEHNFLFLVESSTFIKYFFNQSF